MRILIVGTTYYPDLNGQAIFMVNFAEGLARRGHEVAVTFPESRNFSQQRNNVQLEAVGSLSLAYLHPEALIPVFFNKRVRQIFDDFQPEIVHIQDHYPLSRAVLQEAKKRGIRAMGTNHFSPENLEPYIPALPGVKPLYDRLLWNWMMEVYNQLDIVTAPSRVAVDLILKNGLRVPAFPISCGTDLTRFYPDHSIDRTACRLSYGLDPDKTIFLYVGRLDKEKRVNVLLHTMSHIQRDDIQLAIAGRGAEMNDLAALSKKLELGDRVHFINSVQNEDLRALLNSVDVFSMASETESLSIASLEAMACGLPLLVADAYALQDLVTPHVNGFRFKPGDAADAAHYMSMLADHPECWREMGEASLEKVRPHGLENVLLSYEKVYSALHANIPLVNLQLLPARQY